MSVAKEAQFQVGTLDLPFACMYCTDFIVSMAGPGLPTSRTNLAPAEQGMRRLPKLQIVPCYCWSWLETWDGGTSLYPSPRPGSQPQTTDVQAKYPLC